MLLNVAVYRTVCDSNCMWLLWAFLTAASCASLPNRAHCDTLELHCFLGKMPQASVQEMRGVGACRLKCLQWRHAMASFIRCLTSWTIKLSSMLNQSQILFFYDTVIFTHPPSKKGLCLYKIAHTHWLIWGTLCYVWNEKLLFQPHMKTYTDKVLVVKGTCKCKGTNGNIVIVYYLMQQAVSLLHKLCKVFFCCCNSCLCKNIMIYQTYCNSFVQPVYE